MSKAHTPPRDLLSTIKEPNKKRKSKNSTYVIGGAGRGIRTPVGLHPNGFQDRLVMTASIFLQIKRYFYR